ncbi:MAG: hypothetical protein V4547_17925 [Bacteroidota bacterium]
MNDLFTPKGNWDNHKILLELALEHTINSKDPILELGAGDGSSPCLQGYSKLTGRKIESYDFNQEWADKWNAKKIDDWDEVDWSKRYSVALVDESPGEHRHKSLMLLKDNTDIVIVHDSEPAATGYMLDKIWHFYKYKVDLRADGAWATMMSNTVDVVTKFAGKIYDFKDPDQHFEITDWNERNKVAFCSLAFGEKYITQLNTLTMTIDFFYPHNPIYWTAAGEDSQIAENFKKSLYGFKPHIVRDIFNKGYRKIVLFDPAMIVNGDFLSKVEELGKIHGVVAVKDDNPLINTCSTICRDYFNLTDEWFADKHLVGGSFYYFDFNSERCKDIFNMWMEAEVNGIFGSQEDAASGKINSHRYDETVMAIAMYKNGAVPLTKEEIGYCVDDNSVLLKKHFK